MNRQTPGKHLASYYRGKIVPAETAARLKALALADPNGTPSPARKPRRGPMTKSTRRLMLGALAMVPMIVYLLLPRTTLREPSPAPVVPSQGVRPVADHSAVEGSELPNLVAVRFHADWCPRCPMIASIYGDLSQRYRDQPVLFVTLDVTNGVTRRQSWERAQAAGIGWVYPDTKPYRASGSYETGMIQLVDRRRGEVLAVVTGDEHLPRMEGVLAEALRANAP